MKCTVPEIAWHNRDPVLSADFQYNQSTSTFQRLVTGGTDCHVVIWYVKLNDKDEVSLELASDLRRHNKAVNVVRFSPSGEFVASGDDEAAIWIWKKSDKEMNPSADLFNDDDDKETNQEQWSGVRMLRGHIEDVYDLCWSPDSASLISGSVDNSAILWDVHKGKKTSILSDHKGFVQGVSWDPLNKYVATLSSDRVCRIYNIGSQRAVHKLQKVVVPGGSKISAGSDNPTRSIRLFHDDTLKSFCRRLTFSPDGQLLITPSGIFEGEDGNVGNVTYVFSRACLNKPALFLPAKDKCTIAVRCCPILFELRAKKDDKPSDSPCAKPWEICSTMFKLPYRIVFAVATQDSVLFYDTQQPLPFGQVSNIHYTRLSDLAWSRDGRILIVSSTDGYCSFITFKAEELGTPYRAPVKPTAPAPGPFPSVCGQTAPSVESASLAPDKVEAKDIENMNAESKSSDASLPVAQTFVPTLAKSPAAFKVAAPSNSPSQIKQHKRIAFVTLFTPKLAPQLDGGANSLAPGKVETKATATDTGGNNLSDDMEQPMEDIATVEINTASKTSSCQIEIIDIDDGSQPAVDCSRNKVLPLADKEAMDTFVTLDDGKRVAKCPKPLLTSSNTSGAAEDSAKLEKAKEDCDLVLELSNVAVGSRLESAAIGQLHQKPEAASAELLDVSDSNKSVEADKPIQSASEMIRELPHGSTETDKLKEAHASVGEFVDPPVDKSSTVVAPSGVPAPEVAKNSTSKTSTVAAGFERQPRRVSLITLSAGKRAAEPEFGDK